ncbi:Chromosome partition protein Smc [Carpediemonas membranifera]|uniref:Chromosome partition protein Smc n=1 Tax=Carpediemonas membranifera TaxID=201153 RepID=A0A8J6AVW7_9EUKA|nr:Chromosome partition protein Smc [Carpediemonas membranifera]|eukprot:KAG9392880.1 Chromosome partition protein Smc [Carpediemonas membranifera]
MPGYPHTPRLPERKKQHPFLVRSSRSYIVPPSSNLANHAAVLEPEAGGLMIHSDGRVATRNKKDYNPRRSGMTPNITSSTSPILFSAGSPRAISKLFSRDQITRTPVGTVLAQLWSDIDVDAFASTYSWECLKDAQPLPQSSKPPVERCEFDVDTVLASSFERLKSFRRKTPTPTTNPDPTVQALQQVSVQKENAVVIDILTTLLSQAKRMRSELEANHDQLMVVTDATEMVETIDHRLANEKISADDLVDSLESKQQSVRAKWANMLEHHTKERDATRESLHAMGQTISEHKETIAQLEDDRESFVRSLAETRRRPPPVSAERDELEAELVRLATDTRKTMVTTGKIRQAVLSAHGLRLEAERSSQPQPEHVPAESPAKAKARGQTGLVVAGGSGAVLLVAVALMLLMNAYVF